MVTARVVTNIESESNFFGKKLSYMQFKISSMNFLNTIMVSYDSVQEHFIFITKTNKETDNA